MPTPRAANHTIRRHVATAIICLLTVTVAMGQTPDDPWATVRQLYESASYEEALVALGRMSGQTDEDEIDEYRALCLLGLNRARDAEQAVERLVMRRLTATQDLTSHPPKFVALYRAIQKRALPVAAAARFASAKASFEEGHFAIASAQFKELLKMLSDPIEAATLNDLRMLADGFLRLSDQRLVDVNPPARLAAPTPPHPSPARRSKEVYGSDDPGVVPPEIIDQRMPKWVPPNTSLAARVFQGMLEVIVSEGGRVESRIMAEPAYPAYDSELLRATRQWHYRPATREGRPVKYRKFIAVTLAP